MVQNLGELSGVSQTNSSIKDLFNKNGLESEIEKFVDNAVLKIKFSIILKPAIISFIALLISFFIDVSWVPFLGNVSTNIAHYLFPSWNPTFEAFTPFTFWWLPLAIYILYVFLSYLVFNKLKVELVRTPASETIDRIMNSYTSIIDSISTALPLIGAAILLLSIRLGEEVFLGLSVPFEIKALIVLALGKLFEPILDQMGIEFQNVVNHVKDVKEKYFSRVQTENSINILKKLGGDNNDHITSQISENSVKLLGDYNDALHKTYSLSEALVKNYNSLHSIIEKINKMENITT
ncbi:MAG TPA: hypothetical protein ENI76_05855, partial [Ignavibacteria bacterium]|nr:hypothetical protein [Ignavibacteria bacterium]